MPQPEHERLGSLLGQNLAGWMISHAFFLELDYGSRGRGTFPAVTNDDDGRAIITLDRDLLSPIWERLEKRPARIACRIVLANESDGVAYDLAFLYLRGMVYTKPLRIFSAAEIEALCQKENSVRWAGAQIGLNEEEAHNPFAESSRKWHVV